nr:hypothetical protein [Nitrosomonas sp.]
MLKYYNVKPIAYSLIWMLLTSILTIDIVAAQSKNPELYKQELLAIEKRLDAKLKEIDDKLERLEKLESTAASANATAPAVSDDLETTKVKKITITQTPKKLKVTEPDSESQASFASLSYGKNGFVFKTDNNKFSLAIQNRIQTRYSYPFDSDPRSIEDLQQEESSFRIRRARTRLRGHAYWPWLTYYLQYDWSQPVLRDLNLTVEKFKWAKFWLGRGKVLYNDERVTSSANQQFVNRSIVNDIFTVDRQQGVQVFGNLFPGTWHDISYYAGIFTGLGVGEGSNDDENMMYSGRLQWNVLGGEMPFTQSDIEYHENPALNFAFAASTNRSKCTAFQTDNNSCRDLPGFVTGQDGQYRINQMMEEVRLKLLGFSLLH